MSRRPHVSGMPGSLVGKLDVQRIRVNREGYDATGAYWGAGPDVFIVTTPDGAEELTLRAANAAEARSKADAELAGKAAAASSKQPIGGKASRKTRNEFAWQDPVTRQTITIRVTQSRDYLVAGTDHLEVESLSPKRAALPITETGYRSHFMPALDLINAGGAVVFVKAWLADEAAGKAWLKRQQSRQQGDLFDWGAAQGEVSKSATSKPQRPTTGAKAAPRRKPAPR